ncbi:MAG TPA: 30S ribosomal protein S17 [Lentisphaeria bacterium]|nr:MAG: 30S ribosomal protein S17 [Lentisphaerae bacterium GWF2_38_69]HBM16285.1 30S ribosomal protein S17 [Lentisphaeria bacterium]
MENEIKDTRKNFRKEREGVVLSDCQNKTIVVEVTRRTSHPLYKKVVKSSKKYYAHDEENKAKKGDKVTITETRPLSKLKRWRLVKVHGKEQQS